jgi:FixJ family two-component response regulator
VFEATCAAGSLLSASIAYGGILTAVSGDETGLWLSVSHGQDVDVRSYVEAVRVAFPGTEIVASRVRDDATEPGRRFRADYAAELSDRQREVFEAAYFGWPRERTGSEFADSLDISQPTFSRHHSAPSGRSARCSSRDRRRQNEQRQRSSPTRR